MNTVKTKKTLTYYFGAFLAFLFQYSIVHAQSLQNLLGSGPTASYYGIDIPSREPSLSEKIISVILSPISITIFILLAVIIGITIFIKHKRRNVKKNS